MEKRVNGLFKPCSLVVDDLFFLEPYDMTTDFHVLTSV